MRSFIAIASLVFCALFSNAQEAFTVKYFGLTIHPKGDAMAHLQPNRLDPDAKFVANVGVFLGYEKFFYKDLYSVKVIQGFLGDCSNGFATVSHLGLRANLMNTQKHRVYVGIGPTLILRESWYRFDGYVSSSYFNDHTSRSLGQIQWKMVPYGFEFEYDYVFNPKNQLSISFTPGVPIAGLLSVGWKHWIEIKEFDHTKVYKPVF
jgi:hypothetical protein